MWRPTSEAQIKGLVTSLQRGRLGRPERDGGAWAAVRAASGSVYADSSLPIPGVLPVVRWNGPLGLLPFE